MLDYAHSLGDAVKCTRDKLKLTQSEVAEMVLLGEASCRNGVTR